MFVFINSSYKLPIAKCETLQMQARHVYSITNIQIKVVFIGLSADLCACNPKARYIQHKKNPPPKKKGGAEDLKPFDTFSKYEILDTA